MHAAEGAAYLVAAPARPGFPLMASSCLVTGEAIASEGLGGTLQRIHARTTPRWRG